MTRMILKISAVTAALIAGPALASDGDKADTPLGKAYMALLEPMQFAKIVGEECEAYSYDQEKASTETQAFIEGQMDAGTDPDALASISDYVSYDTIKADFGAWLEENDVAYGDTAALCVAGIGDETVAQYLVTK